MDEKRPEREYRIAYRDIQGRMHVTVMKAPDPGTARARMAQHFGKDIRVGWIVEGKGE